MADDKSILPLLDLGDNRETIPLLVRRSISPLGVLPFVGAGLSAGLGYPSWREFLLGQAERAGQRDRIEAFLKRGEYEEAAEELVRLRGALSLNRSISATYGHQAPLSGATSLGVVELLPHLTTGPVITTNYDPVVEEAFRRCGTPLDVVVGARITAATRALDYDHRVLLKLHGDAAEETDRILTRSEYERHYGRRLSRPLPRLLEQLIIRRPLVFLGCSLEADRTMHVLAKVARNHPSIGSFAILPQPASATMRGTHSWRPSGYQIGWTLWRDRKRIRSAASEHLVVARDAALGRGRAGQLPNTIGRHGGPAVDRYLSELESLAERALADSLALSFRETSEAVTTAPAFRFSVSPLALRRGSAAAGPVAPRDFSSFEDAFRFFGGRVLLLGDPGAGKTTTLLEFARKSARAFRKDQALPFPLLVEVRKWDHATPVSTWARTLLPEGCDPASILYLFDGLDELGGPREARRRKVRRIAYDPRECFLRMLAEELPDAQLVLTSRSTEYAAVGLQARLRGAVVLQPLSKEQVLGYAGSRGDGALATVLRNDERILEMARTPLMLAMLEVAIAQGGAEGAPDALVGENAIFDAYVRARFEHEESHDRIPFTREEVERALRTQAKYLCCLHETAFALGNRRNPGIFSFACRMHFLRGLLMGC